MLILSRRPNEAIIIGENIRVTVLGVKGNQVRLGVSAPKTMAVDREEIYERKRTDGKKQKQDARATKRNDGILLERT